jgi:23S rRNA (pseudouridine1915-N3)-methyltransferase
VKITIVAIGKTNIGFVIQGVDEYIKRLKRYVKVELQIIPDVKNSKSLSVPQLIQKEEELLINALSIDAHTVLLDERGKQCTSLELSSLIESKMISGTKELVFVIGGAYGVSEAVKHRANEQLSMSKLTFSHQMIRLILAEQIYRAMTIIRGEPYHHE